MAGKSDTSVGSQLLLAVVILFATWVVLRWVIRVFFSVATTIVVVGAILFLVWTFLRSRDSS